MKILKVYLIWVVVAAIIIMSGVFDRTQEVFLAAKMDRRISNQNLFEGVYLEYAYLSGDEIVVLFSAKDGFGTEHHFTVDEIIVNGTCSIKNEDLELFANTSNAFTSPPGYLYGSYGTEGGELTVNYTAVVSLSYWDNVIMISIVEDVYRDLTRGNQETPTAISELCAKG